MDCMSSSCLAGVVTLILFMLIVVVVTIVGNFVVIAVILCTDNLCKPFGYLKVSLAFSDLFLGEPERERTSEASACVCDSMTFSVDN